MHATERSGSLPPSSRPTSATAAPVGSSPSPPGTCGTVGGLSIHEASRAKKAVLSNVKAIENRIRFFKREEEKIWRDLEEVRRQAAVIEEGRTRALEKRLADRTIQQSRELQFEQNRLRALATKSAGSDERKKRQMMADREKKIAGEEQRRMSQDILRQKHMQEAQARLQNSERAVAIQRAQLESKLRVNQERAARIERLRIEHEAERQAAELEVTEVESRLPELEAQELACLQQLQNSRIVTQSVLAELETSLGKNSAVTSLLRSKQRGQEHLAPSPLGSSAGGLAPHQELLGPDTPEQLPPPKGAAS